MSKERLINAVLSRDKNQLRKLAGRFNGTPVLCYLNEANNLITFDAKGKPLTIDPWPGHDVEAREAYFLKYHLICFTSFGDLQSFVASGRPVPPHQFEGLPPWSWIVES